MEPNNGKLKIWTFTIERKWAKVFKILLARFVGEDGILVEDSEVFYNFLDISCWLTDEEHRRICEAFPSRDLKEEVEDLLTDIFGEESNGELR